jgi:tight adherence protein B
MPDYKNYVLQTKEKKQYYLCASVCLGLLGFLFYRSVLIAFLCALLSKPLEKNYLKYKVKKRQEILLEGFRDMLYSVSGSIAAGRQMPSAIADARKQAMNSYGENAYITKELALMVRVYEEAHGTVEELLSDFGERSGLAEIKQFGLVYRICKHSGGDLEDVTLKCANLLLDRISFQGEVNMLTAQKKLDILFLVSLPIIVLLFLNLLSSSYINVLYVCVIGRIIMTCCLFTIGFALLWSLQLTEVRI